MNKNPAWEATLGQREGGGFKSHWVPTGEVAEGTPEAKQNEFAVGAGSEGGIFKERGAGRASPERHE